MITLIQTSDGWGLDLSGTPESETINELFGATVLPLPLTASVTLDGALEFARKTEFGSLYGVKWTA